MSVLYPNPWKELGQTLSAKRIIRIAAVNWFLSLQYVITYSTIRTVVMIASMGYINNCVNRKL
jgi:hypothetical protein